MARVALISFLRNAINIRSLASFLASHGREAICIFCPGQLTPRRIQETVDLIHREGISLVGISTVTDDFRKAAALTGEIKRELSLPVIWGGAHVNVRPEESLQYADMICLGEGEEALFDLVESMNGDGRFRMDIPNIWYRSETGIVRNDLRPLENDLNRYPPPDMGFESFFVLTASGFEPVSASHFNGEYSLMTSRGCPYSCHYCYNSYRRRQYRGKGRYLRMRSVEHVIDELVQAKKRIPNLSRINFWDDSFVARRLSDFNTFKRLYSEKVDLPFFALIEPMAFDFRKIRILRECGLEKLQVGIQTGSERVNRDVYNRPVSNAKVLEMARLIHDLGIEVVYDIIFNNPYETPEDLAETVRLLLGFPRPFSLQGYSLIFYPGTRITEKALKDGYISYNEDLHRSLTIQGKENSPISMKGAGKISDRFYNINYSSDDKSYWNSVVSLFASNHFPRPLIRFFNTSDGPFNQITFKAATWSYAMAASIKHRLFQ